MSPCVVVVGAGMGGLSAAAVLAARGFRVTLLERAEHLGGKVRQDTVVGRSIDAGPTVMTMRWALERVFQEAGADLNAHVGLTPLPLLARHHWPDGSSLDLHTDIERSFQEIAGFAGAAEATAYLAFCRYGEHLFDLVGQPFLAGSKPSFGGLLALAGRIGPLAALDVDGHRTMATALASFFRDPRLRQLFGRYATYVGSSPLTAPATLNVIAHVERLGVWSVDGGMATLPRALAAVARERGAVIRQGADVASIEVRGRRAVGVRLVGGELIPADAVVFNGDVAALTSGLLGTAVRHSAPDTAQRSLSAITFSMVARVRGRPLARHTVFFAGDAAQEIEEIEREGVASSPTVYVCAQDRSAESETPAGAERLFFIVNARADGARRQWSEENLCSRVLAGLGKRFGVSFEIEGCETATPAVFGRRFPGTAGALYGPATTGMFSSLLRARERSRVPGLYLCGGSAHPGPGVPMAATSGLLAARAVSEDLGSTSRSRATDTRGGMSTR